MVRIHMLSRTKVSVNDATGSFDTYSIQVAKDGVLVP